MDARPSARRTLLASSVELGILKSFSYLGGGLVVEHL